MQKPEQRMHIRLVMSGEAAFLANRANAPATDLDRRRWTTTTRAHWLFVELLTTQDVFRIWFDRRYVICWEGRVGREKETTTTTPSILASIESSRLADHLCFRAHTGPSRCFPFWQDVLACYVVNTSTEDDSGKKKCSPVLEDYYECLHHRKEVRSYPV